MLGRQKVLLCLISCAHAKGLRITKTFIDKALFVLGAEYPLRETVKFYNFYPHHYGPFSNLFYSDMNDLQSRGYIYADFKLSESSKPIIDAIEPSIQKNIDDVLGRFDTHAAIVGYVYEKYPKYTARSVLKKKQTDALPPGIFSIGYEKKDIDLFLDLLIQNSIEVVVDVRANPFSMNFSFVKSKLESSLANVKIKYLHLPQLGITGEKRKKLETDEDYQKLFAYYSQNILPKQDAAIKQLLELGQTKRIALLCFEADLNHCHRGVLSKRLEEAGHLSVTHL